MRPLIALMLMTLSGCAGVSVPLPVTLPVTLPEVVGGPVAGAGRLQMVAPGLMMDRSDPAAVAAVQGRIAASRGPVAAALGSASQSPLWRVCTTPDCDRANGITTRGLSYGNLMVNIGSRAWEDPKTYVHERTHAEMHAPDLMLMRLRTPVPVWFDEGMATLVSGTVGADLSAAECAALSGRPLPSAPAAFTALTREIGFRNAYGAATCRVREWVAAGHPTQSAIGKLRSGSGLP